MDNTKLQTLDNTQIARDLLKNDLAAFATYLGWEPNWHHLEWFKYLENSDILDIVTLSPRDSAKSTAFSVIYPLWEMIRNPSIRIIIVSATATQAQSFLRQITDIIENHVGFRKIFGNLKPGIPDTWKDSEIIINRPHLNAQGQSEKDPTISATGSGGPIPSKRCDIIVNDDILSKENTRTDDQRRKTKEWYTDVLLPVLVKGGRKIWIATAWNLEDLSFELMQNPMVDVKKTYRSIYREADREDLWLEYKRLMYSDPDHGKEMANAFFQQNRSEMFKGAQVLWPAHKNYKDLYDIRIARGSRAFSLSYQNEAANDEYCPFKSQWIESSKDTQRQLLSSYNPTWGNLGSAVIAQGVDLAISEKELANETIDLTLAKTDDGRYILLNIKSGKLSPGETRSMVSDEIDAFHPDTVIVESNAYQASFTRDMQETRHGDIIRGFQTTGEKFDPFIGVNSIAVAMENGKLVLPYDRQDARTMEEVQKLIDDMMRFPSGHTGDRLMALYFAFTGIRYLEEGGGQSTMYSMANNLRNYKRS